MLSSRRSRNLTNAWPGFVDALASVLLVFVFMLMIFVLGQYYLTDALLGRDRALDMLKQEVAQLAETLSMSEETSARLKEESFSLSGRLDASLNDKDQLTAQLDDTQSKLALSNEKLMVGEKQLKIRLLELASLQQDINTLRNLRNNLESRVAQLNITTGEKSQQISDLGNQLGSLRDRSKALEARLADSQERTLLAQSKIDKRDIRIRDLAVNIEKTNQALREEQALSESKRRQVLELSQQMTALQEQLSALASSLELSQQKVSIQKIELGQLTQRLNIELARKVKELNRYRSEFFGTLRKVLGDHPDIRIVGDRFTFQSELLFQSAADQIEDNGKLQLKKLAQTLNKIAKKIPAEIDWVLRIDGHTDKRPISTGRFPTNWELSTARAISIVKFLIEQGVPPTRLAATGFGEFHPLDPADNQQAYNKNRRIEIKLTGR